MCFFAENAVEASECTACSADRPSETPAMDNSKKDLPTLSKSKVFKQLESLKNNTFCGKLKFLLHETNRVFCSLDLRSLCYFEYSSE